MAKYKHGEDAIEELMMEDGGSGGSNAEFYRLKSGSSVRVRAMTPKDLVPYTKYGIFGKINSFAAEEPSVYNKKGYPESNLTPWDKAFKHYSDLAFKEKDGSARQEELRKEARKYLGEKKFVMGFIDLATGEPIYIDFSKKQARIIFTAIQKKEAVIGKKAFEIEKTGVKRDTVVSATVLDLEELTDTERENFEKADGFEFTRDMLAEPIYEADEKEQVELLKRAGFDVTLIGYDDENSRAMDDVMDNGADDDDDLPF